MSKNFVLALFIIAGLSPTCLWGQTPTGTDSCYEDTLKGDEAVFTKIQVNAFFKSGDRSFRAFLLKNIDHGKLIRYLTQDNNLFADTARIKFIISKYRIMSNLSVDVNSNAEFREEIENVVKQSACFWVPGNYSGRFVNGWYRYDIFYLAELNGAELNISINFKSYDL